MTVPQDLMFAHQEFDRLLVELMDALDLTTRHQVYAVLYAVLHVFRRRLEADQTLIFADALPAMVRAIFVAEWDENARRRPFLAPEAYDEEVRAVRRDHNLAPPGAHAIITRIVRSHCDGDSFDKALSRLPSEAAAFWTS